MNILRCPAVCHRERERELECVEGFKFKNPVREMDFGACPRKDETVGSLSEFIIREENRQLMLLFGISYSGFNTLVLHWREDAANRELLERFPRFEARIWSRQILEKAFCQLDNFCDLKN